MDVNDLEEGELNSEGEEERDEVLIIIHLLSAQSDK